MVKSNPNSSRFRQDRPRLIYTKGSNFTKSLPTSNLVQSRFSSRMSHEENNFSYKEHLLTKDTLLFKVDTMEMGPTYTCWNTLLNISVFLLNSLLKVWFKPLIWLLTDRSFFHGHQYFFKSTPQKSTILLLQLHLYKCFGFVNLCEIAIFFTIKFKIFTLLLIYNVINVSVL